MDSSRSHLVRRLGLVQTTSAPLRDAAANPGLDFAPALIVLIAY